MNRNLKSKKKLKIISKEITLILVSMLLFLTTTTSFIFGDTLTSEQKKKLEQTVNETLKSNSNKLNTAKIISTYKELTNEYSNEQIADVIEENKDKLIEKGVSQSEISASTNILRNTDSKQVNKILDENIDINDIQKKVESGYTPSQIVKEVSNNITPQEKFKIFLKLLYSNKVVKEIVWIFFIILIFRIILRWIIYAKAGKHGFSAIIPIYNEVVYYKVCNMNPWILLFLLIPILGAFILLIFKIVSRFELSYSFGKKGWFGLGLFLFPTIFEAILALSKDIKYVKE